MKTNVLKITVIILLVGLASCNDKDNNGTWICKIGNSVIKLKFYSNGEDEGKFYTSVKNDYRMIMFNDDVWTYYKIVGDMMYVSGYKEIDPEINRQGGWFVCQPTEDILVLTYAGYFTTDMISGYLFKAQN